jgi:hypothetical protein
MMKISRRDAIRNCFVFSVGAAMIPACLQEKTKPAVALKHIQLDGNQQKLIIELCETIIPKTDTPGAKDTNTHLFVLKMLDDCNTKEQQEQFVKGMKAFDQRSKEKFDKSFVDCSSPQRADLLTSIIGDKSKDEAGEVGDFYRTMKRLTLQGYMTSQYYLTNVRVYKLVPGKFSGCIPVTKFDKKGGSI